MNEDFKPNLDYKKLSCDLCNGTGEVSIVIKNEWGEEYNSCDSCPLCDGSGSLKLLSVEKRRRE